MNKDILLSHLEKLHTTKMGEERIRRNLNIDCINVVDYCKQLILHEKSHIYRQGKNWYVEIDHIKITIHASSYTIITAHMIKKKGISSNV